MPKFRHIIIALLLFSGFYFSFRIVKANSQESTKTPASILSPLPKGLTTIFQTASVKEKYWEPNLENKVSINKKEDPELTAHAALSYDLTTGKVLFAKNPKERTPLASLTKIMTAIVALENMPLDKEITVSKNAATIGENAMGLSKGEVLPLQELLYGLMLPSGNDAAEAIAEGSKFGRDNFVYVMNSKAEQLGLADTRFTNPSGLEGDGKQYSTAYDLLVMTRYALENPVFREVVSTVNHEISATENHKAYHLFNETNLLTSYPGVKGVKTGFTNEAGLCLVTYLEHDGHQIIAVILNSQNRRQEMKDLLDYSLQVLGKTPPEHQ